MPLVTLFPLSGPVALIRIPTNILEPPHTEASCNPQVDRPHDAEEHPYCDMSKQVGEWMFGGNRMEAEGEADGEEEECDQGKENEDHREEGGEVEDREKQE